MDAPVSPAGLPAIGISAAREDTEEMASVPAMSVQDDGTDANAIGPREGGPGVPLTAEALAIMGLNDPRRNAPGAVSECAYVTGPTHYSASCVLGGIASTCQFDPLVTQRDSERCELLPTACVSAVVLQQNDTGRAVAAEAEARHS